MQFQKYIPKSPANQVVAYYWTLQDVDQEHTKSYRFIPDGYLEWIFHLRKPWEYRFAGSAVRQKARAHLMGQFKQYMDLYIPEEGFMLFGVKFFPWTAQSIWGINMEEATETHITLSDLSNPDLRELEDKVGEQKTIRDIIDLMDAFLIQQMVTYQENDMRDIISILCHAYPKISDCKFPLSQRRIEQRFKFEIGISPKLFQRTIRINRLIKQLLQKPTASLTDIAYQFNFSDQSHFINDFKQFTGCTPSVFLKSIEPDGDVFNLQLGQD